MTAKIIVHPSARRAVVKRIMAEVRAIKNLRRIAKELKGYKLYNPEIAEAVLRIKGRRLEKIK